MTAQILNANPSVLEQPVAPSIQKYAWLQKLDLAAIARQYSTPLYITNRAQILRHLKDFEVLLGSNHNIYFPVKASPCLATFKMLAEQGCGADCASAREIQLARLAGIPASRLSYYSPAPDIDLAAALLQDGGSVVIDSPSKLAALEAQLNGISFPGKLFLRVNPPLYNSYTVEADYQKHTSHGNLTSQFGLPSEEVLPLLNATQLKFSGLHIHVGTQMDNVDIFQESLDALHELCDVIHAVTDHTIEVLNLGGGLGIAAHQDDNFPSISELADALKHKLRPEFAYKMEPGNALFGDASVLLTKVVTRKSTRGKGWAIIDIGSDQLFKVTLAGFEQEVLRVDGTPLPRKGIDSIAGPLCFAGDVILPETDLTGIEEEDLLVLPNVGSYCRAVGTHFNGHSEPGTLIVDDSREIGLVYDHEDSYWEPIIQSFRPQSLEEPNNVPLVKFNEEQVNNIRSVYLHKQCGHDTYSFKDFTRVSTSQYEMDVEVNSEVSFISAPLVMRVISDAVVAVTIDHLGHKEKNMSVWGSRFNVSLNSILRSNRPHRLRVHLTSVVNSSQSKNREFIAYWQLGEGSSYGNILVVV